MPAPKPLLLAALAVGTAALAVEVYARWFVPPIALVDAHERLDVQAKREAVRNARTGRPTLFSKPFRHDPLLGWLPRPNLFRSPALHKAGTTPRSARTSARAG